MTFLAFVDLNTTFNNPGTPALWASLTAIGYPQSQYDLYVCTGFRNDSGRSQAAICSMKRRNHYLNTSGSEIHMKYDKYVDKYTIYNIIYTCGIMWKYIGVAFFRGTPKTHIHHAPCDSFPHFKVKAPSAQEGAWCPQWEESGDGFTLEFSRGCLFLLLETPGWKK